MPWLAIAGGAKLLGGLFGSSRSRRAAKEARALGEANATYIEAETAEQSRRLGFSQSRTRGTVRSQFAASGFRSGKESRGASQSAYLKTLSKVQKSELDWISKSGASRADIARRGGQMESNRLKAQGTGMFISGVAGAASMWA